MKNIFRHSLIIALFAITLLPVIANAKRGVESGGGGGVVWANLSHPVLMDYFTIINSVDELQNSSETPSRLEITVSDPLLINKDNKEEVKNSNNAYAKAFKILGQWTSFSYAEISSLVEVAFEAPLIWNFTDNKLSVPPFYLAPSLPEVAHIEVAAYYYKKDNHSMSVSISRPIWNQMQLRDQAGLLIHEALRQVQFGFGNGYDDETLQRITAIYLLCKPTNRLNYYMFYLLNNSPLLADKIYGSFRTFIKSECRGIE